MALRLSDRTRRRLLSLLGAERPEPGRFLEQLRRIGRLDEVPAFAATVRLLANLEMGEAEAERLLRDLLGHRQALGAALGRDPGMRVAAVDYLSNVEPLLTNPKIVEMSQFEETERSAVTDSLTGLYNRRYFHAALQREVRRSGRYGLTFSLLMLDFDQFKRVNDAFGHLVGDQVLSRAARVIRREVRDADVPCRFGGEEFAVIFPETERLGTYTVAERIRRAVRRRFLERPVDGREIPMSVSGGIATFPVDGRDAEGLVARADETLYAAKKAGRDRIVLHPAERRRSVRFPASPSARVSILGRDGASRREALAVNLSLDGALVEADGPWRPADAVRLVFRGRRSGEIPARVVRVEPGGPGGAGPRLGLAFARRLPEDVLLRQVRRGARVRPARGGRS